MRKTLQRRAAPLSLLAVLTVIAGCRAPGIQRMISVVVIADGESESVSVERGANVDQALQVAGVSIGELDTVEPPAYTVPADGDSIRVTRVQEIFETEKLVVAFERQTLRNDELAEGESRLVQEGLSGLQEVTYRVHFENGVEVTRAVVKAVTLREAVPEILMVGARGSSATFPISGTLAYLAGGNAWVLEGSTATRRLLAGTGDLDGRIFALSPSADHLLFTRRSKKPADQEINTLWAVSTRDDSPEPFSLRAANIVHFADWIPGTNSVAYSTVEPRGAAPGWQANNDLQRVSLAGGPSQVILEPSAGGVYGWWGMRFGFSADGKLAYARADQVGLVDQDGGYLKPLMDVTPFNTRSDWVWVPGLEWSSDSDALMIVTHAPPAAPIDPEDSQRFDLASVSLVNSASVPLVVDVGMFAYASAAEGREGIAGDRPVAFLQAILPDGSDRSGYRLTLMDQDGSNQRILFPAPDAGGLDPQVPVWSPASPETGPSQLLAVIFEGDLWFIEPVDGKAFRVTGDGMLTRVDWR